MYTLLQFKTLDSTMEEARRFIHTHKNSILNDVLILAEEQTKGRGRQGRAWISEPGNLYLSFLFPLKESPLTLGHFSFIAAVALREVLAKTVPSQVLCKWPNDVFIREAKVGGILLEREETLSPKTTWLIIGVGVNLHSYPQTNAKWPATCLKAFSLELPSVQKLADDFYHSFYSWYKKYTHYGFTLIRQEWLTWSYQLGEQVAIYVPHQAMPFRGKFCDLDLSGACVLETDQGRQFVYVGDFNGTKD